MATTGTFKLNKFTFPPDHPLAAEHQAVAEGRHSSITDGIEPATARRYVAAALEQARHWDAEVARCRDQGKSDMERLNAHMLPGWNEVWNKRRRAADLVASLMKRMLPLTRDDLLGLAEWISVAEQVIPQWYPLSATTRAIERYAKENEIDAELRAAVERMAGKLSASYDKDVKPLGTRLQQLVRRDELLDAAPAREAARPIVPAPAGDPRVLVKLKRLVGVASPEAADIAEPAANPDEFIIPDDSPLREEHQRIAAIA